MMRMRMETRLGAAGSLGQEAQMISFCPIGHLTLALVPDHVDPWPLASWQGISGVTAQLWPQGSLKATVAWHLFPYLLLSTTHLGRVGTKLPLTCH